MKIKITKLFFLINVLLISISLVGCKMRPQMDFEIYYSTFNGNIIDNKVIFVIGNNLGSAYAIEESIKRYVGFKLEIYIDDETTPYDSYEIDEKDVFSTENKIIHNSFRNLSSYNYQIPLCFDGLTIDNQIKIVFEYIVNRRERKIYQSEINGETIDKNVYIPQSISKLTYILKGKMINKKFNLELESQYSDRIIIESEIK